MTLNATSLSWAIDFIVTHSDGDLFPRILEVEAVGTLRDEFIKQVVGKDLGSFSPGPSRRFVVPKDEISYRQATQLHPQDSILLSAVLHQFGQGIEDRRLPATHVFSYRFAPTPTHGLYGGKTTWNDFWTAAHKQSLTSSTVLYCDIADFYNQIYHHTVENQLIASGFPNQAIKWVIGLLESTTVGVSRGVPVGPHGAHLIAEATLIPIDNSMVSAGIKFMRYADDIVVFCDSEKAGKQALAQIAVVLDRQQRLMLQRHKTKFLSPADFRSLCIQMIEDRPISQDEDKVLKMIKKYSGGNPYQTVLYSQISADDWNKISETVIRGIIQDYLAKGEVDFVRLRWFYRRLSQIGHPGAIDISLEQIEGLGPCLANVCTYLTSVQAIDASRWTAIGTRLLTLLESDQIKSNEFFRLLILSLFSRNADLNHFSTLASRFQASDHHARREIILAARKSRAIDWLREHKEAFEGMDAWQKIAFIFSCSDFPADEKKYFLGRCTFDRPFENVLVKWSKRT